MGDTPVTIDSQTIDLGPAGVDFAVNAGTAARNSLPRFPMTSLSILRLERTDSLVATGSGALPKSRRSPMSRMTPRSP